jgi:hypothetical protein
LYNAWLVEQIEAGSITGLRVVPLWTNVLFDVALSGLLKTAGLEAAERISASALVLIWVWGAFALVSAMAGRRPWFLMPCIAILAYGWVFHMGLFNFYLSLGLSMWALGLFWRRARGYWILALALLLLAATAHLVPVAWAVGAGVYTRVAWRVADRSRIFLAAGALGMIFLLNIFLTAWLDTAWAIDQTLLVTGIDQAAFFGVKYFLICAGLLILWVALLLVLLRTDGLRRTVLGIPFQIYLFTAAGILLIPYRVHFPGYHHALVYIPDRMSLVAAVVLCAVLGAVKPPRWLAGLFGVVATLFFSFLYADVRALNRMEDKMETVVDRLPPGQRVVSALCDPSGRVDPLAHLVDRVCIGRCFSYANSEASTGQFRVRAAPDCKVVVSQYADSYALQTGNYVVKERDIPIFEVYFCSERSRDLCVRPLSPGEKSGRDCVQVMPSLW